MKSSINIQPVSSTSEAHNQRLKSHKIEYQTKEGKTYDITLYHKELSHKNESKIDETISDRLEKVKKACKEKSGRKLQKNATPIREGVVNLKPSTTMQDLERLTERLKKEKGIKAFQIYIHRDEGREIENEGKKEVKLNHHAHILFDWTNDQTGKMLRLGKQDMRDIQDIVSEELKMERGQESNLKHLPVVEYKLQEERKRLNKLQNKLKVVSKEIESIISSKEAHRDDLNRLDEELVKKEVKVDERHQSLNQKLEKMNKLINQIDSSFTKAESIEKLKPGNLFNKNASFEEVKEIAISATHRANEAEIAYHQNQEKIDEYEKNITQLAENYNIQKEVIMALKLNDKLRDEMRDKMITEIQNEVRNHLDHQISKRFRFGHDKATDEERSEWIQKEITKSLKDYKAADKKAISDIVDGHFDDNNRIDSKIFDEYLEKANQRAEIEAERERNKQQERYRGPSR